ncbi:MAG: DUF2877 domain-containing protein [Myxococcales bacterium]|jgi:hypothetical protein|nr:DUF2877 domain-containing protein [Myxococcales bacterium]
MYRRFDSRLALSLSESLTLRIEAIHTHAVVTEVVDAQPAASFFAPRPSIGRSIVLLHPARSLVPLGIVLDDLSMARRVGETITLHCADLTGEGVDLSMGPVHFDFDSIRISRKIESIRSRIDSFERDFTRQKISERFQDILRRIRSNDFSDSNRLSDSIVGLGIGSTPTGDDLLTGLLAALDSMPFFENAKARLHAEFREIPITRTTRTSIDMLWNASFGYYPEALRDFVHALADEQLDESAFDRAIDRLERLGATSGQDMMEGVFRAFCLKVGDESPALDH